METTLEINYQAVARTLQNLPKQTRNKMLRPALRAGANVVKKGVVNNLRVATKGQSTGIGAKNIAVYTLKQSRGRLRVAVMVKKGAVNQYKIVNGHPVRVGLYLSVLEYGKKNQPPKAVFRGAARQKQGEAFSAIQAEAKRRLDLAVKAARQ